MSVSPAQFGEQQQLFPIGSTRKQDPGEQSFDKWLEHPATAYHGSFREDWSSAPYAHYGDVKLAAQRLRHVGNLLQDSPTQRDVYYTGESSDEPDVEPQEHTGRVYARRLSLGGRRSEFSDVAANTAQYHQLRKEGYEDWETPASVRDSMARHVRHDWNAVGMPVGGFDDEPPLLSPSGAGEASRLLGRGKAISYRNALEAGDTNESFVAPRSAARSWEGDVLTSKHSSSMAKQVAKQRISEGREGAVPFPSQFTEGAVQQLMFPKTAGVGDGGQRLSHGYGFVHPGGHRMLSQIQFTTQDA